MSIQQTVKDGIAILEQTINNLTAERDYLDGRLAEFENMARDFVEYKAPDHICRMHFEMMLKECDEKETK
jgi:hypothetical protein